MAAERIHTNTTTSGPATSATPHSPVSVAPTATAPSTSAPSTSAAGTAGSMDPPRPQRSATASLPAKGAFPVLRWALRMERRALLGWSAAVAVVTAIYVSFWPAMGDTGDLQSLIDNLPEALVAAMGYDGIGSPAGYLESTVYGLLAPILLLVFALSLGARLIAGEEEAGGLELEVAGPIGRTRLLMERYAALVLGVVWLGSLTAVVSLTLVRALGMDVGTGPLIGASVGLILLVLALGSLAFAVGAATGRRAVALAVGAAVAVLSYMANALAPLLDDGAWLERLSPFFWYLGNDPLNEGLGLPGAAGLLVVSVVSVVGAVVAYDRRDLGV